MKHSRTIYAIIIYLCCFYSVENAEQHRVETEAGVAQYLVVKVTNTGIFYSCNVIGCLYRCQVREHTQHHSVSVSTTACMYVCVHVSLHVLGRVNVRIVIQYWIGYSFTSRG